MTKPPAYQANAPYPHPDIWTLTLNRYHRDNLLALLELIMSIQEPWSLLNSGDWVAEVMSMLAKKTGQWNQQVQWHLDLDDNPNLTEAVVRDRTERWLELQRYNLNL